MTGRNGTRTPRLNSAITGSTGASPDLSAEALAAQRQALDRWAAALGALETGTLSPEHQVDAAMLADAVARRIFELDELREHTWNPLLANPGRAVYQPLARDFAPLPDRLASVAGRLAGVPAALAAARQLLGPMPRVHLETAIAQFSGTSAGHPRSSTPPCGTRRSARPTSPGCVRPRWRPG